MKTIHRIFCLASGTVCVLLSFFVVWLSLVEADPKHYERLEYINGKIAAAALSCFVIGILFFAAAWESKK
jgi:hypothetical protein